MTRCFTNPHGADTRRRPALRPQAEMLEGRLLLTAGDLDLSFGTVGSTLIAPTGKSGAAAPPGAAVAVLADGKILVGGTDPTSSSAFALFRRNPDNGSPDTSFGNGGRSTWPVGTSNFY